MSELENSTDTSEVDNLLNEIETTDQGPTQTEGEPVAAPTQQQIEEFTFKAGGKEVKANRDQLIQWASRGYEAPNKIGELSEKLKGYTEKEKYWSELEQKFKPVDDYVRANPQFWDHVQKTYQQTMAEQQQHLQNNPLLPVIESLKQEMTELKQYKQDLDYQKQDEIYMQELGTIKKEFNKFDFDTPDIDGKTLEYKVLEHAKQNGIKSFKTAFLDLNHSKIISMKEDEIKERLALDKQSKSKLGILGISQAPTTRKSDNIKGKSYDDITKDVLAELGLT